MANFEVKFNKNKNAMDVFDCDNGVNYSLKIKNMAPDHSFPRWTVVDLNTGKALASLSGGGSYGWIIHSSKGGRMEDMINIAAKAAKKINFSWLWNNVQTY